MDVPGLIIVALLFGVIFIVPAWMIVSKAGYSGSLSLLMLIPYVNIVLLWVFAFQNWPVLRSRGAPSSPPPPPVLPG